MLGRGKGEEGAGLVPSSTPVPVAQDPPSEVVAEGEVTPVVRHIKTEQVESTTPLDSSLASSKFISSLKVWGCLYWEPCYNGGEGGGALLVLRVAHICTYTWIPLFLD